jgi:hypothetical protein
MRQARGEVLRSGRPQGPNAKPQGGAGKDVGDLLNQIGNTDQRTKTP